MNDLTPTICQILIAKIGKQNRITIDRILGQLDILKSGHRLNKLKLEDIIYDIRIDGMIERLIYNNGYYVSNDVKELKAHIAGHEHSLVFESRKIAEGLKTQLKEYEEILKEMT